MSYKSLKSK